MASSVSPKRFALLVGIDLYLNDGSRKSRNGGRLSLCNLQGCVNDAREVQNFLRHEFYLEEFRVLTSSVPSSSASHPEEPPDRWPTFNNIKREFDTVLEHASAGDLFFFHFSGHGARLQPTSKSPPGRLEDPSLLTMDFCLGKPAVRGWQLNEWLRRLNENKIRTIVILDSCHSGGSWRDGGRFRTPEGWDNIPNLPADEEAITETVIDSRFRNGVLEASWSINPDGFTLMAACESHQKAAEKTVNGKSYGAFTYGLLACLRETRPSEAVVTYRNLRDRIAKRLRHQTPRVYGRDRLAFFGDKEPFSATPLVARVDGDKIVLPIGKVHGVREGSEFTTYPLTSDVTFSVDQVADFECSAPAPLIDTQDLQQQYCQVIPWRWSLGSDILQVLTQSSLGSEFQGALHAALQGRLVGEIEITELDDGYVPDDIVFKLTKRDDGAIDVSGPPHWIGYEGPVRGLDLDGDSIDVLATKSAIALTHLTRFAQVLGLRDHSAQQPAPFEVTLKPEENCGTHERGQKIAFAFRNTTDSQLHFAFIVLSCGFHVKQLYPAEDAPNAVDPGRGVSFSFNIEIPARLHIYNKQRDVIRIAVTRGRQLSWKSLELPDVWNADQLDRISRPSGLGRDARVETDVGLWIKDYAIVTKLQGEGSSACWVSQLAD